MGFLDRLLGRSKKAAGRVREAAEDVFERDERDEGEKLGTEPPRGSETGVTPPPGAPTPPAGGMGGSTGPGGGNPPSPAA